jgi:hypothetical protein
MSVVGAGRRFSLGRRIAFTVFNPTIFVFGSKAPGLSPVCPKARVTGTEWIWARISGKSRVHYYGDNLAIANSVKPEYRSQNSAEIRASFQDTRRRAVTKAPVFRLAKIVGLFLGSFEGLEGQEGRQGQALSAR